MKSYHFIIKKSCVIIFSFLLFTSIFTTQNIYSQYIPNALNFATDGEINTSVSDGNFLYIGGYFNNIGKKTGPIAFFKNGSVIPEKDKPIFTINSTGFTSDMIYAVSPDGFGGWYLGGKFSAVNYKETQSVIHLNADNTIDYGFNLNFENSWFHVKVIKLDGDYIYFGGTSGFSVYDEQGNLHRLIFRINKNTKKVDPSWNPDFTEFGNYGIVNEIEFSEDKVFAGGWLGTFDGIPQDAFAVINKSDGSRIDFPTTSGFNTMKLMDDTLLIANPDMYWSDYPDGFGYIHKGLAMLDEQNDLPNQIFPKADFYTSIPDGNNGWYAAGTYEGTKGVFHLDENLNIIENFTQTQIDYYFRDSRLLFTGDALYLATDDEIDVNGNTIKYLFKLDPETGDIDGNFAPNPNDKVYSLAYENNTLYVGGEFDNIEGQERFGLASFNVSSGNITNWKPEIHYDNYESGYTGEDRRIRVLTINNGFLYAGGIYQISTPEFNGNGTGIYGLCRYNLSSGELDENFHIHTSYYDNPEITDMAFKSNNIYVTGFFDIGSKQIKNIGIVNINNNDFQPLNTDINFWQSDYYCIPQIDIINNSAYIWGMSAQNIQTNEKRPYFITINLSTNNYSDWNPAPSSNVNTFTVNNDNFLISGDYYFLGHVEDNLTGININTKNYVLFPPISNSAYEDILDIDFNDNYIFLAGEFEYFNGTQVNGLARLNRNNLNLTSFNHNILYNNSWSYLNEVLISDNGLYVVGKGNGFNNVGGVPRQNICLLDPETAQLQEWNPPKTDGMIKRVFAYDSNVIVTGEFGLMPAFNRKRLAKIDLETGEITDWAPYLQGSSANVYAMGIKGQTLYIGGEDIEGINGNDIEGELYALSTISGSPVNSFNSPDFYATWGDEYVDNIQIKGNKLYISGQFDKINGQANLFLARLDAVTGEPDSWNVFNNADSWNPVSSFLATDDYIYIGGNFGDVLGEPFTDYSAMCKADLNSGNILKTYDFPNYNSKVKSLTTTENGNIFAGTNFYDGALYQLINDSLQKTGTQPYFYYGIRQLLTKGNYIFALGDNIKEYDDFTDKDGIFVYNTEIDSVIYIKSLPVYNSGDIKSIQIKDNILTAVGDFSCLNGNLYNEHIAFTLLPEFALEAGVTSWTPDKANDEDPFGLIIKGYGFNENATVKLYNGKTEIFPDSLKITNSKLSAYFQGSSFTPGLWNMEVKVNDTLTQTFDDALTVNQADGSDVWVDWTGPNATLLQKPTTFYLLYGNNGTSDAYGVFLYIAVKDDQTVVFPDYIKPREFDNVDWDTIPNFVEVDYFLGEPYQGRVYSVFIPYIPAGFENAIKVSIISDAGTHDIRVAASQPIYDSYQELQESIKNPDNMIWDFMGCIYSVAGFFADLTPGISCIKAAFDNIVVSGIDHYINDQDIKGEDIANSIGLIAIGCVPGEAALSKGFMIARGMASLYATGSDVSGAIGACGSFAGGVLRMGMDLVSYMSHDPNAKYGPQGRGSSSFVKSDMPFNYIVTYENDSSASAPAQRVFITDTLDINVFDINTFKAIGFGFGDTTYIFNETDGDTVDIDMRPERNIIVRVFYDLDKNQGILKWTFLTLDPNTYQLIEDFSDGFLPPNQNPPEGEGNIIYSITPYSTLQQGTEIKNTAYIVFDWNEPITTNGWENITDDISPESAVNPLPSLLETTDINISWDGTDQGSDIYAYTIYVSENDSTYYPWIVDIHENSAVFTGTPGKTYKFYSIAVDSAGNIETAPTNYDAKTTIAENAAISEFDAGNNLKMKLFPVPAKDNLTVYIYLPQKSKILIDVLNSCGISIMDEIKRHGNKGANEININVSHLPSGVYLIRTLSKQGVRIRKFVIEK